MQLPPDIEVPYFAYGLFKPGELAHQQIQKFLDGKPIEAYVHGSLWIRDGLPLLDLDNPDGNIRGYLLHFRKDSARKAYRVVSQFEPKEHYRWRAIILASPKERTNVLVGYKPRLASIEYEGCEWFGRCDPVFTSGLTVVCDFVDIFGNKPFESAPSESFEWERLFRLQMAYLLLWSTIERYAALCYGPKLDPMEKIKRLGDDPVFASALKDMVTRKGRVYDSRNPDDHADLDPQCGISSAKYYYLVRNNLSHRGKGAWKDGEIVRQSLAELLCVFQHVLKEQGIFNSDPSLRSG